MIAALTRAVADKVEWTRLLYLYPSGLTGELAQYARVVGGHERAHVAFLRETLGSRAKPAPRA